MVKLQTRAPKLIIFDWDGTLMDSAQHIVNNMLTAIETLGLPAREPEQISELIGLSLNDAFQRLYGDLSQEYAQQLLERYRQGFVKVAQDRSMLFAGAQAALDELRSQGYLLAVATGKSRAGLDRALNQTQMHEYFCITRCADESADKPHPQMLFDILQETGLRAQDALMIGDTEYDMQMARSADVAALGVVCGVHTEDRLAESGALQILADVAALPSWLQTTRSGSEVDV